MAGKREGAMQEEDTELRSSQEQQPLSGGEIVAGVQVKVEDEGSYDCAICFMSVRGSTDALRCTRCSSNPFHGACLVHAGFPDSCPQCSGNTLVAGVRAPVPRDAMQTDLTSDMQSDLGLSVAHTALDSSTADTRLKESSADLATSVACCAQLECAKKAPRKAERQECSEERKASTGFSDAEVQEEILNIPEVDGAGALLEKMDISEGFIKQQRCKQCGIAEGEGSHKNTAKLSRCLGCKLVFYCSR